MKENQTIDTITFDTPMPSDHTFYLPLKISWVAAGVAATLNILVNGVVAQYMFGEAVLYESLLLGMVVIMGATFAYVLGWTALYRLDSRRLVAYRVVGVAMALVYTFMSLLPYQPCNGWPILEEFFEYDDPRAYFGVSGTIMENLVSTFNAVLQGYLALKLQFS